MWLLILSFCLAILLVTVLLISMPFPSWNAYLTLWKYALFVREPSIDFKVHLQQIIYLLKYSLRLPFFALLWFLDDLIFPGYRSIQVKNTVFLITQPRSGSTFLHRTLVGNGDTFVSVRNIDFLYPSILAQKLLKFTGIFDKLSKVNTWGKDEQSKVADKMHSALLLDYEEDDCIFSEFFLYSFFITTRFPFPKLLEKMTSQPSAELEERMLRVHKKLIQKSIYLAGGDRIYLSKITDSHTILKKIVTLYPEALFISQARNPDKSMNSELAQVRSASNCRIGFDVYNIAEFEEAHLNYRVTSSRLQIEVFESLEEEQKLYLSYDLFVENIANTVQIIYDYLKLTMNEKTQEYLAEVQESQKSRKRDYKTGKRHFSELEFYQKFVEESEKKHADKLNETIRL